MRDEKNNFEQAKKFNELLGSEDCTYQTFCDEKILGKLEPTELLRRKKLTKVIHGTIEKCFRQLCELSSQGAGIFVTINQTDLTGRQARNIVRVRAFFADHDSDAPVINSTLEPTFTVLSKNGPHRYWVLENEVPLSEFSRMQANIAAQLGTDPQIIDLPRVMRLPGFQHQKNRTEPFDVRIVQASGKKYNYAEIQTAFPIQKHSFTQMPVHVPPRKYTEIKLLPIENFHKALGRCAAFKKIITMVSAGSVLSHAEGFALFHLAMHFEGGTEWFIKSVPGWAQSQADIKQLEQSLKKKYAPWSCATMQMKHVCSYQNPNSCMTPKKFKNEIKQPNPYWLAK